MKNPLHMFFGDRNDRALQKLKPLVQAINAREADVQAMTDVALKEAFGALKERYAAGAALHDLLPESFALTREAAQRSLGLRPYDVQLMGGIVLHQGKIAEMKTGEGKTLMATLAASLNALTGEGVHMVTVNDYLAQRDAEWMAPVYGMLGLTCAPVVAGMEPPARQAAYAADITYATNNEIGFDYLRDNMSYRREQLVQRPLAYAIVDEVDSILVDEARTPLVISGPIENRSELYITLDKLVPHFQAGTDFELDEKFRSLTLTDEGVDKAERLLLEQGLMQAGESLFDVQQVTVLHHLNNALRAHHLFEKDVKYIVQKDEVVLIDEFTGRMSPGRRLGEGLHQAIEAKEGVTIQRENQSLASITYQNYFRLYKKLAGMTGTAVTEAEEFAEIYNLDVVVIPTNVPITRRDEADIVFRKREAKHQAIVADIKDCYDRGQPVLVGTTSIEKSETLAGLLKKEGIPHLVLNARHHEQEADIIAQAGRKGAVTIATNMAGRGTDIKLGGNLDLLLEKAQDETEASQIQQRYEDEKAAVLAAGGLRVIGTERHESRRIDNQLRGRSGRQGDPGSSVFYLSLEDDLMRIFSINLEQMMARFNMPEHESVQHPWVAKSVETAQRKIEGMHFDARKHILKFDNVLNEQRKVIYKQRYEILMADSVADIVKDFRHDAVDVLFHEYLVDEADDEDGWNVQGLQEALARQFNLEMDLVSLAEEPQATRETLEEQVLEALEAAYQQRVEAAGEANFRQAEQFVLLQVIDQNWRAHLQQLEYLRSGVNWRGYAQKDPLNEFSREAFLLFDAMLDKIRMDTVHMLSYVELMPQSPQEVQALAAAEEEAALAAAAASAPAGAAAQGATTALGGKAATAVGGTEAHVPRNAPCPCGSGKRYKNCCGKVT